MILYYLRHGEKEDHPISYFKPLTPKGKKQARMIGKFLKGMHFNIAFVSSYVRTRETFLELPITYDKLELSSDFGELKERSRRAGDFLRKLKALPENYVCLMVGHGNFQRALVAKIMGIRYEKAQKIIFDNAGISKYWITKDDERIIFLNFTYDLCKGNP